MQKAKRKGKAAAEAAAFPVMEESKMETIILYHRKRKPPRITRGGPDHAVNTNTILPILVYRYAPNYTPGNEKAALSARLSRKHPKITRPKERRMKTIIGSLFPLSIEKPPGALFPTAHANHDATAEAASRYLQDVSRACSEPMDTRGYHKKR